MKSPNYIKFFHRDKIVVAKVLETAVTRDGTPGLKVTFSTMVMGVNGVIDKEWIVKYPSNHFMLGMNISEVEEASEEEYLTSLVLES